MACDRRALARRWLRRIARGFTVGNWLALGWLAVVAGGALAAPLLRLDTKAIDLRHRAAPPSWAHLLGTTRRGTDMLALIVDGARRSLLIGLGATVLAVVAGGSAGLLVGYSKGWVERIGVLVSDTMIALPSLAVALVASLVLGPSRVSLALLVGVLLGPGVFRVVRAAARAQAGREYVIAARSLGARTARIVSRELLPNTVVPLVAYGFVVVGLAILIEGALAFLGVGASPGSTSWGSLIAAGQGSLERSPHLALVPAFVLIVTLVAFTVVGDGVQRDGLKPRAPSLPSPKLDRRRARVAHVVRAVPPLPSPSPSLVPGAERDGEHAALSVRGLRVGYHTPLGTMPVLDGIDIDLRAGRTLAVVGESGSGKSTLVRAILGLLPANGEITGGTVTLDGQDLVGLTGSQLAAVRGSAIALVMQNPTTALHPMRTIGAQLIEPMRLHRGLSTTTARLLAVELLERVSVPDPARRLGEYPFQLSGGLAQRVCIALALSCSPRVLLADEPTSSLDTTVAAQVLDLLAELKSSMGLAVLLVSHSLDLVASRADDVVVLHAGRLAERAGARTLFAAARMPYTRALLAAVPRMTNPSHTRLAALPPGLGTAGLLAPGCAFAPRCERADDRCRAEAPPITAIDEHDGHDVACWHPY